MKTPNELKYTKDHEWLRLEGDIATVGITDHAQNELSDVVYIEVPKSGKPVEAGDTVAVIESVKAASDIYAPVAGQILEGNEALNSDPAIVNSDPYGSGWIYKIKVSNTADVQRLKTAEEYQAMTGT